MLRRVSSCSQAVDGEFKTELQALAFGHKKITARPVPGSACVLHVGGARTRSDVLTNRACDRCLQVNGKEVRCIFKANPDMKGALLALDVHAGSSSAEFCVHCVNKVGLGCEYNGKIIPAACVPLPLAIFDSVSEPAPHAARARRALPSQWCVRVQCSHLLHPASPVPRAVS